MIPIEEWGARESDGEERSDSASPSETRDADIREAAAAHRAPLCIDLCCGYGGWARGFLAAGYRVIGYDNEPRCAKRYPGEFRLMDIRDLHGGDIESAHVFVASPPCLKFTTVVGKRRDPEQGMVLVREVIRVIREADPEWWVIENVRGSFKAISRELGPPMNRGGMRNASVYLWGRLPPFIVPRVRKGWKRQPGPPGTFTTTEPPSKDSWENSIIHPAIARALAEACRAEWDAAKSSL